MREAVRAGRDEQIRKRKGRKNKRHRTTEKIKEEKRKKNKEKRHYGYFIIFYL